MPIMGEIQLGFLHIAHQLMSFHKSICMNVNTIGKLAQSLNILVQENKEKERYILNNIKIHNRPDISENELCCMPESACFFLQIGHHNWHLFQTCTHLC